MKRKYLIIGVMISFLSVLPSCSLLFSLFLPKEYVPDDKVVFLKQKVEFDPIRYDAVPTDPYVFLLPAVKVNAERPDFLTVSDFASYARPDYEGDHKLFLEVSAHFAYVCKLPVYNELRAKIEKAVYDPPKPLPFAKGDKTQDFTNAAEYAYPGDEGARITVFGNGDYRIVSSDKSTFFYFANGDYRKEDGKGKVIFSVWTKDKSYTSTVDGVTWTFHPQTKKIETEKGSVMIFSGDEPQIEFQNGKSSDHYVFFQLKQDDTVKGDSLGFREYAFEKSNGLRIDYFPDSTSVLVTSGGRAVTISKDNIKIQSHFDSRTRKAEGLVSYYLPEGIALTNLDSSDISYSEVKPAWPENYKSKQIGPFTILYVAADEPLVAKLSSAKLSEVDSFCRNSTGISAARQRTIIIPPNLESYRKMHADRQKETLNWYPSGFQTKDIIVMWPFSAPRYNNPAGQDYFYNVEFYEILAHEYTHLMVGEASGILCPVPVWLNEGLAVYVESKYSEEARRYWELTYDVSKKLGRILPWDDVTEKGTGEYPVAQARVHYAQSYAMTKYLISKYGVNRVAQYVRSFRVTQDELEKQKLVEVYKDKFKKVFGSPWEDSVAALSSVDK